MEKQFDIIGIANPVQDLAIELEKMPTTVSEKMYDCCFQGGGWVATALCAAGNLGMKVSFCGIIGDDLFGKMIQSDFKFNNVDTSHLIVKEGKTSNFCTCITERSTKSKTIIGRPGSCGEVSLEDIDSDYICSARMLHVGFVNEAVRKATDLIHSSGGKVSVDAAYYKPYVYENYDIFDIFIGSEYYFNDLARELGFGEHSELSQQEHFQVMQYIKEKGPQIVIFTFGADGCMGVYDDKTFSLPAIKVEVVDTTGAGDVFHGAFDAAYLKGMDVRTAAEYATAVSTIKCTQAGGRAGIPDGEMLGKFLKTGKIDYEKLKIRAKKYHRGILEE